MAITRGFFAFVLVLAAATAVAAQPRATGTMFHGRVVSAATGVLGIQIVPEQVVAFQLAPYARILRNGRPILLEQLRIRDDVAVMTDASGTVATTIVARSWRGS